MNNNEDTNEPYATELKSTSVVFSSKKRIKKKALVMAVVLLLAVLGLGFVIKEQFFKPSALSRISLSDGTEISLGEKVTKLEKNLSGKIRKTDDGTYEYPSANDVKNPLQARLFVDKGKLVAIRMRVNKENQQIQTGIYPRMPASEVASKTNNQAKPISEVLKSGVAQGYVLEDDKVTSYYLVNPCAGPADEIVLVALALKGYEDTAKDIGAGCGVRS